MKSGSIVSADYDKDGDLDLFIVGTSTGVKIAKVYRNTGNNFTEDANLTGTGGGSAAFGDYDNDGDLDILHTGTNNSSTKYLYPVHQFCTVPSFPLSDVASIRLSVDLTKFSATIKTAPPSPSMALAEI
jgi:hypothetical protein